MARSTRPVRRVGPGPRSRLRAAVYALVGWGDGLCWRGGRCSWRGLSLRYAADKLVCRPSQLRRCLLGLPVSARAAARMQRRRVAVAAHAALDRIDAVGAALLIAARRMGDNTDRATALRVVRAAATSTRKDPVPLDVSAALQEAGDAIERGEHLPARWPS